MTHILLRHRDIPDIHRMTVYKKNGGFAAFKNAVTKMKPSEVTDLVKSSNLRGRGGAGFPTGTKWSFIDNKTFPHYVVANADESEPGTFKDREILENNPLQFLEGLAIASYAVSASAAYVYLRGESWQIATLLDEKIAEMEKAGYLGENLSIDKLREEDFYLGDEYQVGTSVLRATGPRYPCNKLNYSSGDKRLQREFEARDWCGIYFEVIKEGRAKAGDAWRGLGLAATGLLLAIGSSGRTAWACALQLACAARGNSSAPSRQFQ